MPTAGLEVFFQPAAGAEGSCRLYLHHPPHGVTRGALLYVHPFAEEMNKSRRMAAMAARALAERGFGVLQIDLLGCGDSSGDFSDATWDAWIEDVVSAFRWLAERYPKTPVWLWGLRVGALLCRDAATKLPHGAPNFLFWQPSLNGRLVLAQFLRLRATAAMNDGGSKSILEGVRADLASGQHVHIAGYSLGAALASGLESAALEPPPCGHADAPADKTQVLWLEMSDSGDGALSPAAATCVDKWTSAGFEVRSFTATGPRFWQTVEIEDAPALIDVTIEALTTSLAKLEVNANTNTDATESVGRSAAHCP